MGKIRKERRHKLLLKTPGTLSNPRTSGKKQDDLHLSLSAEGVIPLPEDIMKSLPVLGLSSAKVESQRDSDKVMTKKEKRKAKKEDWRKSTLTTFCSRIELSIKTENSVRMIHFKSRPKFFIEG